MKSLNELYQDLHNLEAQLSQTDSIAIARLEGEDVTAYGDIRTIRHGIWEQIVALKAEIAEQEKAERPEDFEYDKWADLIGHALAHDAVVEDDGLLWQVITPHIAQVDWKPANTPALFKPYSEDEYPDWVQPTGAQDAYAKGAKVSHLGKHWISDVDSNVWEPSVYGWTEEE